MVATYRACSIPSRQCLMLSTHSLLLLLLPRRHFPSTSPSTAASTTLSSFFFQWSYFPNFLSLTSSRSPFSAGTLTVSLTHSLVGLSFQLILVILRQIHIMQLNLFLLSESLTCASVNTTLQTSDFTSFSLGLMSISPRSVIRKISHHPLRHTDVNAALCCTFPSAVIMDPRNMNLSTCWMAWPWIDTTLDRSIIMQLVIAPLTNSPCLTLCLPKTFC